MGRIHCCGIDNVLQISRKLWTTDSYVYRKKLLKILIPAHICQVKFICLCLFEYPRLSVRLLPLRLDSIPVDQFQFKEHRERSRERVNRNHFVQSFLFIVSLFYVLRHVHYPD